MPLTAEQQPPTNILPPENILEPDDPAEDKPPQTTAALAATAIGGAAATEENSTPDLADSNRGGDPPEKPPEPPSNGDDPEGEDKGWDWDRLNWERIQREAQAEVRAELESEYPRFASAVEQLEAELEALEDPHTHPDFIGVGGEPGTPGVIAYRIGDIEDPEAKDYVIRFTDPTSGDPEFDAELEESRYTTLVHGLSMPPPYNEHIERIVAHDPDSYKTITKYTGDMPIERLPPREKAHITREVLETTLQAMDAMRAHGLIPDTNVEGNVRWDSKERRIVFIDYDVMGEVHANQPLTPRWPEDRFFNILKVLPIRRDRFNPQNEAWNTRLAADGEALLRERWEQQGWPTDDGLAATEQAPSDGDGFDEADEGDELIWGLTKWERGEREAQAEVRAKLESKYPRFASAVEQLEAELATLEDPRTHPDFIGEGGDHTLPGMTAYRIGDSEDPSGAKDHVVRFPPKGRDPEDEAALEKSRYIALVRGLAVSPPHDADVERIVAHDPATHRSITKYIGDMSIDHIPPEEKALITPEVLQAALNTMDAMLAQGLIADPKVHDNMRWDSRRHRIVFIDYDVMEELYTGEPLKSFWPESRFFNMIRAVQITPEPHTPTNATINERIATAGEALLRERRPPEDWT
jgi:hypothetical protein